jgi:hypothetical protein
VWGDDRESGGFERRERTRLLSQLVERMTVQSYERRIGEDTVRVPCGSLTPALLVDVDATAGADDRYNECGAAR